MITRIAILSDLPSICKLYNEFYAYNASLQPKYCNAGQENGAYPQSVIESNESEIFVAINENDEIVGLIHVEKSKTPPYSSLVTHEYVEVIDLIVSEKYRQKGIGTMLMKEVKNWSKSLGSDYIELFVLTNAESAKKFYEHEGFDVVSQTMRYPL